MKKLVTLLLTLVMVFSLFTFGATGAAYAAEKETYKFGVIVQDLANEFSGILADAAVAEVEANYPDVEIEVFDPQGDYAQQATQIDTLVAQGYDAILIMPLDPAGIAETCKSALDAGVCIISLSANLAEDIGHVFAGSENVEAGAMIAEYAAEKMEGEGKVVHLQGILGSDAQIGRGEGITKVLGEYDDIEIVFEQSANWSREEAMSTVENLIQSGTEFDAILADNDEMALGAIEALKAADLAGGKTIVIGVDFLQDAAIAIKEGNMTATAKQDGIGQAVGAVESAYEWVTTGERPDDVVIPFVLIDIDNVDSESESE